MTRKIQKMNKCMTFIKNKNKYMFTINSNFLNSLKTNAENNFFFEIHDLYLHMCVLPVTFTCGFKNVSNLCNIKVIYNETHIYKNVCIS